jgi:hypothetical protein
VSGLWELIPTDKDSPIWRYTRYKGRVIVRARDEHHARILASERFQTGPLPSDDGPGVSVGNPWYSPLLVICRGLSESDKRWPMEGPTEVLYPPLNAVERRGG